MVRPVEPEPSDRLRRLDPKVKRTGATPDKLGERHVQELQPRRREKPATEQDHGQRLDADAVEIHQDETEAVPARRRPEPDAETRSDHIDVEG